MIPENMKPVEATHQTYDKSLALEVGDVFILNDYVSRQYDLLGELLKQDPVTASKNCLVFFNEGAVAYLQRVLGDTDEESEHIRLETFKFFVKITNALISIMTGMYVQYNELTAPRFRNEPIADRLIGNLGLYRTVPHSVTIEKYLSIGYAQSVSYNPMRQKAWDLMIKDPLMKNSVIAMAIGLTSSDESSSCYSHFKRRLIYTFTSNVLEQILREGAEIQALNVAAQNDRMAEAERDRPRNQTKESAPSVETPSHGFPIDMIEKPGDSLDMNKTIAGVLEQLMELQKKQMTLLGSLIPNLKT